MSKKDKKAVENVVENEINDVENETWTTDADENESVENQTQPDATMPENDEQKDEEENATDENVEDENDENWTNQDETPNDDENVMKTTDGSDNEKNHDNVENVVENEKWLIHVKAIYNRWSIDKGCEYWIEQKFFEEKKYLFEVLED